NKAIFLDKDGTLVEDVPYNIDPERISLLPGVIRGLSALQHAGFMLVLITNQSGIVLGYFTEPELRNALEHLRDLLAAQDIHLTASYYCPHAPDIQSCDCRKPQPGLLLRAARELDLDLQNSWMIGDILDDVEAGRRAGCHTVLIDNGNETEWLRSDLRTPDITAKDLAAAAASILRIKTLHAHPSSI
ncbi:MAG TPA: HAD family hydrolase, partial [Puia sp.]|nr:HAD family hydrolase [Puia sp.]